MYGGRFLKKDEYEGWEVYEDLAKKSYNGSLPTKILEFQLYLFQKRSPLDRGLNSNLG